ncbi:MAG: hypothetical protein KBB95_22110 [Deltaproteobacteria bacterium]|nr:hypothetical protein [Deltaproteobacteria bacterium]
MEDGEHPPESLSRVDLGYFPWFTATLSSPLTPAEISNRIAARIERRASYGLPVTFTGSTWLGAFEIRLRGNFNAPFNAALFGAVERTPDGSHLSLQLLPHPMQLVMLGLVGVLLTASAVALLMGRHPEAALMPAAVVALIWAGLTWTFRNDGKRLLQLVEEECSATLLPRPRAPRTF